jgi:hypothetical protein
MLEKLGISDITDGYLLVVFPDLHFTNIEVQKSGGDMKVRSWCYNRGSS